MTELLGALGGLGLASSAGLNAYIPALITALLARYTELVTLPDEFAFLSSGWVLATLTVLLLIEEVVDKIPGADHVNDIVQSLVRPASGAVLFAAGSEEAFGDHTWLALLVGFIAALCVHGTKAAGRGVINVSTGGIGAPVASVIEDVLSLAGAIIAIVAPILVIVFIAGFVWVSVVIVRKRRERRRTKAAARLARS
ncbi:MAG TPA: DUF4126 domain-containing protein [Microthrixaceae bacterium]|nr:DUF4126 domain-containing protein [Microthrixaceae bacterium]HNI33843.1 DUF4126 domain-containing protein [Microthrixaceae bacterium]